MRCSGLRATLLLCYTICLVLVTIKFLFAYHQEYREKYENLRGGVTCTYLPAHADGYEVVTGNASAVLSPAAWLPGGHLSGDRHRHRDFYRISHVLRTLGYYFDNERSDWRVCHGRTHYMASTRQLGKLQVPKHDQKMNVMPGMLAMTDKKRLFSRNITGMLKGFDLPADIKKFREYLDKHPEKMWLSKVKKDRGAGTQLIRNPRKAAHTLTSQAIQEFVPNPFLLEGKKFDMGVYALITSVDPLRVYINDRDWFIRVIREQYYPFDPYKVNSYITRHPMLISDEESLRDTYKNYKPTNKDLLLHYLRKKGVDTESFLDQIRERIYSAFVYSEQSIIDLVREQKRHDPTKQRSYYEYVRFDLLLDSNLTIHICEIQSPPGMRAETRYIQKERYDRTFYNLMNLLSVAPYSVKRGRERNDVSLSEISAPLEMCNKAGCYKSCAQKECNFCPPCLNEDELIVLRQAYQEHIKTTDFTRLIPHPFKSQIEAAELMELDKVEIIKNKNEWLRKWFAVKCLEDESWC